MRKQRAPKREIVKDPKCNSKLVSRLINTIMISGKKSTAERIVYGSFDIIRQKIDKEDPVDVFKQAIDNIRPLLEVKARRLGGATYQVPIDVSPNRGTSLALRWIRNFSRTKKGRSMKEKLADEIMAAYKKEGSVIKKREDTHKMAEANKAFAQYRW